MWTERRGHKVTPVVICVRLQHSQNFWLLQELLIALMVELRCTSGPVSEQQALPCLFDSSFCMCV